jgi:two-component system response regulator MprA
MSSARLRGAPCPAPVPHVLVIDEDRRMRDTLRRALSDGGWHVALAANGQQGLAQLVSAPPDVVVLDAALPDIDGAALCRRLRHGGNRVPVLMVGEGAGTEHRIHGLDAGADDYLPKPFDVGELRARLRALMRRAGVGSSGVAPMRFAELKLAPERQAVSVDGTFVELTNTEFQLLELLMRNAGTVLRHRVIYDRVWGYDFGPASNALRVYIGYLRRKLEQAGARELLHTVRGVGYVLREP